MCLYPCICFLKVQRFKSILIIQDPSRKSKTKVVIFFCKKPSRCHRSILLLLPQITKAFSHLTRSQMSLKNNTETVGPPWQWKPFDLGMPSIPPRPGSGMWSEGKCFSLKGKTRKKAKHRLPGFVFFVGLKQATKVWIERSSKFKQNLVITYLRTKWWIPRSLLQHSNLTGLPSRG